MYSIELNNVRKDMDFQTKVTKKSPAVEIFSAIISGQDTHKYGTKVDTVMKHVKELATKAMAGDHVAKAELNAYIRIAIEPALQNRIQLFDFLGRFRKVGYGDKVMMNVYKHFTQSGFQASQGDAPLSGITWGEEPLATQTISGGFAVNYREVASGNMDKVAEGMEQVKIDMHNKAMHYVINTLYNAIKNATGVKYFAETAGITKDAVDDVLKKVRRNGRPAIAGDYSVVSQLNGFQGFGENAPNAYSDAALEEIRKSGFLGTYAGSPVVELPNQYDFTKRDGDNFALQLPENLLFFIPQGQGAVSPLQVVQRGDLMSATGFDVTTGTEITRFDLELGAGVPEGEEHKIGLVADTELA